MARKYIWPKGIKIAGYGQFKDLMFETKDRNADLFDNFFRHGKHQDQYWISLSVPKDDEGSWDQPEIEKLEQEIVDDFEYEGFKVGIELEHGSGFPRSFPLTWFFVLIESKE